MCNTGLDLQLYIEQLSTALQLRADVVPLQHTALARGLLGCSKIANRWGPYSTSKVPSSPGSSAQLRLQIRLSFTPTPEVIMQYVCIIPKKTDVSRPYSIMIVHRTNLSIFIDFLTRKGSTSNLLYFLRYRFTEKKRYLLTHPPSHSAINPPT